jgi:hypothetical protein
VIRLAADIGASGRSTLDGGNQVRVARLDHNETSSEISCESSFTVVWSFTVLRSADDERPWRMARTTSEVIAARLLRCAVPDRCVLPATWDGAGVRMALGLISARALCSVGGDKFMLATRKPSNADLFLQL